VHVRFGEFVLEPETRRLLRDGQEVRLGPKAFELLDHLVERRPRALSKAQLRDRLWPRTATSESALSTVVSELRGALRDDPRRPRYVRTVYGFGYAFCAEVAEAGAQGGGDGRGEPRLVWERREFSLREGENLLGRSEDAAARVDAATVSRHHARILVSRSGATLEDLGSKNGTFVAGERLRGPRALRDGDEISLGRIRLIFRMSAAQVSTQTEAHDKSAR
jgi:DNA-binding winged helix-turn-helix (wHTH) protein